MPGNGAESTENSLQGVQVILDVLVYLGVVGLGVLGALNGRPELLALIPLAYVVIALDPVHGRWRHVWQ